MTCLLLEEAADEEELMGFAPGSKCARTLVASDSSMELEWVLPAPMPNSFNTSRI
jgi:hypothetical protein